MKTTYFVVTLLDDNDPEIYVVSGANPVKKLKTFLYDSFMDGQFSEGTDPDEVFKIEAVKPTFIKGGKHA